MFMRFDKGGSGSLNAAQLQDALGQLGLTVSTRHAHRIMQTYDADASKRVELAEFREIVAGARSYLVERGARTGGARA